MSFNVTPVGRVAVLGFDEYRRVHLFEYGGVETVEATKKGVDLSNLTLVIPAGLAWGGDLPKLVAGNPSIQHRRDLDVILMCTGPISMVVHPNLYYLNGTVRVANYKDLVNMLKCGHRRQIIEELSSGSTYHQFSQYVSGVADEYSVTTQTCEFCQQTLVMRLQFLRRFAGRHVNDPWLRRALVRGYTDLSLSEAVRSTVTLAR